MYGNNLLTIQVVWKTLFRPSSCDFGTVSFFKDKLRCTTVIKDHKKDVNVTLDFLDTVIEGHWLACACDILGVKSLDNHLKIPYLKKKRLC